jgi:tripartite-type tricarboxylate transporter receptor subunit TctC
MSAFHFGAWTSKLAASALLAAALAFGASAETYPTQTIKIIVPFPAGGLNDTVARLLAPYLEQSLGKPIIIDNRGGASGSIGTKAVVAAPPDGYTLLMVASSHTIVPATNATLPYDTVNDLTAIAMVSRNPLLFVVGNAMPAKTLPEFVALAKAAPSKFNFASVGPASQGHLVTELFEQRAGILMQHIPYRGGAPAITSLLTGETQFAVLSPQVSLPQIEARAMRAIAVGSLTRDPQFPDIPTVAESGYPGFEAIQWVGLLAPAGTPREIVDQLNFEINRALREPDLIAKFAQQGMSPAGGTPASFQKTIETEVKLWIDIAQKANIKAP